jgi:hypothetical protein
VKAGTLPKLSANWALSHLRCIAAATGLLAAVAPISTAYGLPAPGTGEEVSTPCKPGKTIDPYPVWQNVANEADAETIIRKRYASEQNLDGFINWFRCQDFKVTLLSGPFASLKAGQIKMDAIFSAKEKSRMPLGRASWYEFEPPIVWAQVFTIRIDTASGKIFNINVEAVTK